MSTSRSTKLVGAVFLVALLLSLAWMQFGAKQSPTQDKPARPPSESSATKPADGAFGGSKAGESSQPLPLTAASDNGHKDAAAKIAATRKEFESATNWRAFAHSALSKPEAGGYFYAMRVANACGSEVAVRESAGRARIEQ